jgi:outer membrane immunogenic protein
MKTKLLGGIGMLACIAAGLGAANAADLSQPVYQAPVYKAPVILSDWAGFYLGVHGGYGWSEGSYLPPEEFDPTVKQKGGVFGGHVGYNWQFGSAVVGVEGDFDGADIKGTDPIFGATFKTNELASIRARLGYTLTPDWLVYGTGGAGWANTNVSDAFAATDIGRWGWVAGGGVEYKFYQHWIARAEYLHYGVEDTVNTNEFGPVTVKSVDVVRGGLSYKF